MRSSIFAIFTRENVVILKDKEKCLLVHAIVVRYNVHALRLAGSNDNHTTEIVNHAIKEAISRGKVKSTMTTNASYTVT